MPLSDPSWVWPFWLERQMDPANPEFVPGTDDAELVNLTHRSFTTIGSLATPERATVDPRGLITASAGGWSVDWWIGAEDQWHRPSRAPVVRQRLLGDAPVLETAMRVPGGDALHRAYGFTSTELGPCIAIEIENRTAVPVAVALAVRPYNVEGFVDVHTIDLVDTTVLVDGEPGLVFTKPPADLVGSVLASGDCAEQLVIGGRAPTWTGPVRDPDGWATAAFVFPLTHTATFRAVLPLSDLAERTGRRGRRGPAGPLPVPAAVPTAEQVAAGWVAQTRRGLLATLPDDRLMRTFETARTHLLLLHGGDDLVHPGTAFDFATARHVLGALDDLGFADEARQVLASWSERQALDGTFVTDADLATGRRADATGAALGAVGHHWALTRDAALTDALIGPIAKGVHRVDKAVGARRAERDPAGPALLPVGTAPAYGGPRGAYLRDASVTVAGLLQVAAACAGIDQPGVAEDARRVAGLLQAGLDAVVDHLATATGGPLPATPSRRLDAGIVANLDLVAPFGTLPAGQPAVAATLARIRDRHLFEGGVFRGIGQGGTDPVLTALLAVAELEAGDIGRPGPGSTALSGEARPAASESTAAPAAAATADAPSGSTGSTADPDGLVTPLGHRLGWLLDHAGPTRSWPTTIHPHTGGGAQGSGQDPLAVALFLRLVRRLLVREVHARLDPRDPTTAVPVGLALLSYVPVTWLGQPVDVRDAPTELGTVSFSVRWHGERPALLWELEPHPGVAEVAITAPGLDPSWSSTELAGEALLGAIPPPAALRTPATGHDHDHGDHDHDHGDHDHDQSRAAGAEGGGPGAAGETPVRFDAFATRPPVTPITRAGLLGDATPAPPDEDPSGPLAPGPDGGSFT